MKRSASPFDINALNAELSQAVMNDDPEGVRQALWGNADPFTVRFYKIDNPAIREMIDNAIDRKSPAPCPENIRINACHMCGEFGNLLPELKIP